MSPIIPYVALREGEKWRIRLEAVAGREMPVLTSEGDPLRPDPTARAILGKMNEARQRHVVEQRRCQVCTKPLGRAGFALGPEERWMERETLATVPSATPNALPVYLEPLACIGCAAMALRYCPGLARLRKSDRWAAYRVSRYQPLVTHLAPIEDESELNPILHEWLARDRRPPIGYHKLMLTEYDRLTESDVEKISAYNGA